MFKVNNDWYGYAMALAVVSFIPGSKSEEIYIDLYVYIYMYMDMYIYIYK